MTPKTLFIQTYYPQFLSEVYEQTPGLDSLSFDEQRCRVFAAGFSIGDAHSHYLRQIGCDATEVIVNADVMQRRWADEHGLEPAGNIHDQRRRIIEAQIAAFRPDVVYVFEWCPLGDQFLAEIKPHVSLLVGQISSPLPADRTFKAYDLMISSWPAIVDHFRGQGLDARYMRLGFDPRVLDRVGDVAGRRDVTFVGGFAPVHRGRVAWLERVLREIDVEIHGYGIDSTPAESPIRSAGHGPVWGLDMYRVLKESRVTLNRHACIDIAGRETPAAAANMRLYEATGMGACLITEARDNLRDMFEPDREVLTYSSDDECVERIRSALDDESLRQSVAIAGQKRTLSEHTYRHRMEEFLELIAGRL